MKVYLPLPETIPLWIASLAQGALSILFPTTSNCPVIGLEIEYLALENIQRKEHRKCIPPQHEPHLHLSVLPSTVTPLP